MIVDRTHRPWMWTTLLVTGGALAAYALVLRKNGSWGAGSPIGIVFAAGASAIFVFEILLGLRKSKPAWNLGRAASWARAHVWLGGLGLVLSLLHAGFHVRGTMSIALTLVLGGVTASGLVGLALQQILPTAMTKNIPRETIYEQIPLVLAHLKTEAEELLAKASTDLLSRFYRESVESFLVGNPRGHRLLEPERSARLFEQIKKRLPPEQHDALADLRDICEERAQLFAQERMQRWLHGWLLVHVPLSLALVVLVAGHALMALRY